MYEAMGADYFSAFSGPPAENHGATSGAFN